MTNEQNDSGWDSLADELGIAPNPAAERPVQTTPAPRPEPSRTAPPGPAHDPRPEIEQESEDFGAGLSEGPEPLVEAALYDPGAGIIAEDADEYEDVAVESFADADEGFEPPVLGDEGTEGGKRRRRRRRRKKKGAGEPVESVVAPESVESDDEVEEGEAPAEVEDDDEDESDAPPSAMELELEEEIEQAQPSGTS